MNKKVKFQFEMPEANANRLDLLAREGGVAKKDVINNALTILEWAIEEIQSGNKICSLKDGDATSYKELVLPLLMQYRKSESANSEQESFAKTTV